MVTEEPEEIYGRVMSVPDDVMWIWYRELTEISTEEERDSAPYIQSVRHVAVASKNGTIQKSYEALKFLHVHSAFEKMVTQHDSFPVFPLLSDF